MGPMVHGIFFFIFFTSNRREVNVNPWPIAISSTLPFYTKTPLVCLVWSYRITKAGVDLHIWYSNRWARFLSIPFIPFAPISGMTKNSRKSTEFCGSAENFTACWIVNCIRAGLHSSHISCLSRWFAMISTTLAWILAHLFKWVDSKQTNEQTEG